MFLCRFGGKVNQHGLAEEDCVSLVPRVYWYQMRQFLFKVSLSHQLYHDRLIRFHLREEPMV